MNLRLPPGVTVDAVVAFLSEIGLAGRTEIVDRSEAVEVDRRNVVVKALCAAVRHAGARPTLLRKLGTADLNLAVPAWGCPAAAYGPGDAHLDHTDAEGLDVSEAARLVRRKRVTAFARTASRERASSRSWRRCEAAE